MLQDTERTRSMWACTCPEDDATRSAAASIITAARALLVQRQELRAALPAVQVAEIASVTSNRKWNVQVGVATALPSPNDMCVACVQREKCQAGQRELGAPYVCNGQSMYCLAMLANYRMTDSSNKLYSLEKSEISIASHWDWGTEQIEELPHSGWCELLAVVYLERES